MSKTPKKRKLSPVLVAVMDWMNQWSGLGHADRLDTEMEIMEVVAGYRYGHIDLKTTLGRLKRQTRRCERIHAQNYPD